MRNPTTAVSIVFALCILSFAALAGDEEVRERWGIRAGTFLIRDAETVLRLDAANGLIGTTINFNRTLGVERGDNTYKIDGHYRFNNHHSISTNWYNIGRTGQTNIDIDFNFGDQFFQANADVNTRIETEIFDVLYQYSFYNTEKVELAVQGGLHISRVDAALEVVGGPGSGVSESAIATAPLPVLGFVGRYNFLPKLAVTFDWKTLELEFDDFGGTLRDTSLVVEHRTFKHLGFGFGLQRFDFNLEATKDKFTGSFGNRWDGFYLYLVGYSAQ